MRSVLHPDGPGPRSYGNPGRAVQIGRIVAGLLACLLMLAPPAARAAEREVRIVALGDSLTAGFGLAKQDAFPAKLEKALRAKGLAVTIENAGVSGDTTSGGLARLDWSVPEGTDAVILELGANDALRGLDPKGVRTALETMAKRLKARGIAVLLAGMYAPRNLGPDYAKAFDPIYPDLATAYDLILYPFFLDGIAGERGGLNQPDGLHPTAAGVDVIVARILPKAEELIGRVKTR